MEFWGGLLRVVAGTQVAANEVIVLFFSYIRVLGKRRGELFHQKAMHWTRPRTYMTIDCLKKCNVFSCDFIYAINPLAESQIITGHLCLYWVLLILGTFLSNKCYQLLNRAYNKSTAPITYLTQQVFHQYYSYKAQPERTHMSCDTKPSVLQSNLSIKTTTTTTTTMTMITTTTIMIMIIITIVQ